MFYSRRVLLRLAVSISALYSLSQQRLFGQSSHPPPQPLPSPNAPNPNVPQGLEGRPSPAQDQKAADKQLQQEIAADVDKMALLVAHMKEELSVTNVGAILSTSFVKQAHEIEKLAKRVKDLAKG